METTTANNKIPNCITKKKLEIIFKHIPSKFFFDNLNEIIYDNRKNLPKYKEATKRKIINSRVVFITEIKELIAIVGMPKEWEG